MKRKTDTSARAAMAHTRRDFLVKSARIILGGALGFLGFSLFKRAASGRSAPCTNNYICRSCQSVSACVYPQALSFKSKTFGKVR